MSGVAQIELDESEIEQRIQDNFDKLADLLEPEECKVCIHERICIKDKRRCGNTYTPPNPFYFDKEYCDKAWERYEKWRSEGYPCEDFIKDNGSFAVGDKQHGAARVLVFALRVIVRPDDYEQHYKNLCEQVKNGVVLLPPQMECKGIATDIEGITIIKVEDLIDGRAL